MMKPILVFGILAIAPLAAHANDSSFDGMGGSPHPTRGENSAIRMVRETVVLTANADDFSTQADFVFSNETSKAQNVSMGFPEVNTGEDDETAAAKKTPFIGFATFVDGRQVTAKRTTLDKLDASGFNTYWVKTVPFAPRQTRKIRVQFRSRYGGTTEWGMHRALSYSFTGGNWRGNVAESVLEVRVPQNGLWRVASYDSNRNVLPLSLSNAKTGATFRHVWKNWQAQETVFIGLERATPFWRKDMNLHVDNPMVLKTVAATQTVRIGAKPSGLESSQGLPTEAFTYNNTFYVGVSYLVDKLNMWDANVDIKSDKAGAGGFDLSTKTTRVQGRIGESTLRINGKSVAAGGPILGLKNPSYGSVTYVPLAPLSKALGWKLTLKGERLFALDRGTWKG
ncbi:DUF4424 domain-containing protein [bacterium]|nr:MAG: DUF4424 domain-containing protein [bacterium]